MTWGVHLSVSYLFFFFILFMGFSREEYWSGLPFPFPVDHVLSELSTMTCPSSVALHGIAHSFIELGKAVVCQCDQTGYFSVIVVFRLSSLWWKRIRGLWKLTDGREWLRGKLGLVLVGRAMLSKSLIQFFVDGWSCAPSLLFTWVLPWWPIRPANLENSAMATGLEKVNFHSNPKEKQYQRMLKLLHNCTYLTQW